MPQALRKPVLGRRQRRALGWAALFGLVFLQVACSGAFEPPVDSGVGATAGLGAGGSFQGAGGTTFPGSGATASCAADLYGATLQAQLVDTWRPRSEVLYAWMTPEEEEALRAGGPMLNVTAETAGGRGFGLEQLFAWALGHPDSTEATIAPQFEAARVTWPNPWSTRITLSGETAGSRLLRIQLEPHAWIGRLARHGEIVEFYDTSGETVPLEQVTATPERVALLYFLHLGFEADEACGTDGVAQGDGYRHFIVGNPAMIQRYEVGSSPVLQTLMDDITALSEYLEMIRPCPTAVFEPFEANVICSWGYHADPYLNALSYPSDAYRPTASKVADVIELLEDSLFELDPFVVEQGGLEP